MNCCLLLLLLLFFGFGSTPTLDAALGKYLPPIQRACPEPPFSDVAFRFYLCSLNFFATATKTKDTTDDDEEQQALEKTMHPDTQNKKQLFDCGAATQNYYER